MEEVSTVATATLESVGETLRAAREQQGLSLAEIATRTRVPQRHLEAIEAGSYGALPSPTYATGFVKAYARTVGVDEVALGRRLRGELANQPRAAEYRPYQAPDPARVPSRGLAIVSLGVFLALAVLAGLWYSGMLSRDDATVAAVASADPAVTAAVPTTPAATQPVPPSGGQVSLQVVDRAWLRVHDGDRTLYIGTMAPGERFDVPADAKNPLVDVGRPEQLRVSLNGSALPPLPESGRAVKNLRIGAEAVSARLRGEVAAPAAAPATNAATAAPAAPGTRTADASARPPSSTSAPRRAAARPAASTATDETARANLDGATAPATGNTL
jgi:cytoskeletal protein RodZ